MYGQTLTQVQEAKYLGLTLHGQHKLTFNKHIECICKKANSALEETLTSARGESEWMHVLYIHIRPILEYTAFVWPPTPTLTLINWRGAAIARCVMSDFNIGIAVLVKCCQLYSGTV